MSKFSSQTFEFTVGGIRLEAKLIGLDSVSRSCPIIMYDTEGGGPPGMRQFVRGCGDLSKLELVTKVLNTVSAFHLTEKKLPTISEFFLQTGAIGFYQEYK